MKTRRFMLLAIGWAVPTVILMYALLWGLGTYSDYTRARRNEGALFRAYCDDVNYSTPECRQYLMGNIDYD